MKHQLMVLAAAAAVTFSGPLLAQTADTTPPPTATTTTPTTSNAGAYDALSEGNRKIASAIYEAQLGSANDTASGTLLTRDDIAAMRQDTGWGNVYKQLQQQGYVTERNLGQAISSYNHGTAAGSGTTVVSTAAGDQIVVRKGKSGDAASLSTKTSTGNAAAKTERGKSTVVTTAAGGAAGANAATTHGKPAVVTTAAGTVSNAGAVSNAGGNGHGNGQGGGRTK